MEPIIALRGSVIAIYSKSITALQKVYASVVEDFLTFDDREISIQEVVLARIAETEDVQHIATWDSDFTRYTDRVTLYPRNFWES